MSAASKPRWRRLSIPAHELVEAPDDAARDAAAAEREVLAEGGVGACRTPAGHGGEHVAEQSVRQPLGVLPEAREVLRVREDALVNRIALAEDPSTQRSWRSLPATKTNEMPDVVNRFFSVPSTRSSAGQSLALRPSSSLSSSSKTNSSFNLTRRPSTCDSQRRQMGTCST